VQARQAVHAGFETSRPFTPRGNRSLFDGDDYSTSQRPSSSWSSAVTSDEVHSRLQSRDSVPAVGGSSSGPAGSWGWAATGSSSSQQSASHPVVASSGRVARFHRGAAAAGAASSGQKDADSSGEEDTLDAYGHAVLAGMVQVPTGGLEGETAETAEGCPGEGTVQQQADQLFEQRMAQMRAAEGDELDEDGFMPPSLLGLSSTLSEMQGAGLLDALESASPSGLPAIGAKQALVQPQVHEESMLELCRQMLPQLVTLASAISAATTHAAAHSYGSSLADTAQLTIESSLTLRRRLVRRLVRPLDVVSLTMRVFLSQCVLAAAAVPGMALEDHADALTSPGKPSAHSSQVQEATPDPVRDASALAARHLFVCSKASSLDAVFRDSGCLGVILDVLRMGCDSAQRATTGSSSDPSTPQRGSRLPRVSAGTDSVTGHSAVLEMPPPFHFQSCPAQGSELTYLLGVLKNVSHDNNNASWLVTQGALPVLVSLLEGVAAGGGGEGGGALAAPNANTAGTAHDAKHMGQVAVQGTGVLRNLCLSKRHFSQVWASGTVDALMRVLPRLRRHGELGLNVARIMAKLTLHEPARARFVAVPGYVGALLELVSIAPSRAPAPLVVRVMFSLGNLTATNEATRQRLGRHPDAVPAISSLLLSHTKLLVANVSSPGAVGGGAAAAAAPASKLSKPAAEAADVLVKTSRTAAHLAIDGTIASNMLHSDPLGAALGALLQALPSPVPEPLVELALNVLSVCTNLAFHSCAGGEAEGGGGGVSCLSRHAHTIAPSLVRLMQDAHDDVVVHAARMAANLCRRPETRDSLAAAAAGGVVSAAVTLLHHRQREAAVTACGILMNIVLTPPGRHAVALTCLWEETGNGGAISAIAALTRVVEAAYWGGDLDFSTAAARVLFNHCLGWSGDEAGTAERMTDDEALGVLAVVDGVIPDATGHAAEGKDSQQPAESGAAHADALVAVVDVLEKLRQDVKQMVDAGKVADHEERFHMGEHAGKQ